MKTAQFVFHARNLLRRHYGPMKLQYFMRLRYERMSKLHPHGVFSVGQAGLDFFETAYDHIIGAAPLPSGEEAKSEYVRNYINWVLAARTEK
jgi:hypothetical protein